MRRTDGKPDKLVFFAPRGDHGSLIIRRRECGVSPTTAEASRIRMRAATQSNQAEEALIDMAPTQYLWSYNRYKHPAGAPLPPAGRLRAIE